MRSDFSAADTGASDELLTFAEAARLLPRRRAGRPVHPSTVSRWRSPGIRRRDGSSITLRCVGLPSGWMTTLEWIREFVEQITAEKSGQPAPAPALRTTAGRRRAIERANRELDAIGI